MLGEKLAEVQTSGRAASVSDRRTVEPTMDATLPPVANARGSSNIAAGDAPQSSWKRFVLFLSVFACLFTLLSLGGFFLCRALAIYPADYTKPALFVAPVVALFLWTGSLAAAAGGRLRRGLRRGAACALLLALCFLGWTAFFLGNAGWESVRVECADPDVRLHLKGTWVDRQIEPGTHMFPTGNWPTGNMYLLTAEKDGKEFFQREFKLEPHRGMVLTVPKRAEPTTTGGPLFAVAPFDAANAREHQRAWAKHLGVPVELDNSIGMKLRLIPPGEFIMGSLKDDPERLPNEEPAHKVLITKPYWIGVHTVTVGQFKQFVNAEKYVTEAEKFGGTHVGKMGKWQTDPTINWRDAGERQADDHPVVCVSWNDAKAFCDWLSAMEGRQYALPTEAQWEYACRAGSQTPFYFGANATELGSHAWYQANSNQQATHPVGGRRGNPWGLYDMHGNVWQWCADWLSEIYPGKGPAIDPPGPGEGTARAQRGADRFNPAALCRDAVRTGHHPSIRTTYMGFRVVLVGDPKAKAVPAAPFVILAKDRRGETRHPTLADAVKAAQSGDTIEIQGNGPYETTPLNLGQKSLVLRAGQETTPFFRLKAGSGEPMIKTAAALTLEGLELHRDAPDENPGSYDIVSAFGAPTVRMTHCRLVVKRFGCAVNTHCPLVHIRASDLRCEWTTPLVGPMADNQQWEVEDSVIIGNDFGVGLYQFDPKPLNAKLKMSRSTLVTKRGLAWDFFEKLPTFPPGLKDGEKAKFLAIDLEQNVLASRTGLLEFRHKYEEMPLDEVDRLLKRGITWHDKENLLPEIDQLILSRNTAFPVGAPIKTLADWGKLLGGKSIRSIQGNATFAGGDLFAKPLLELKTADFRLAKGSPGQGVLRGGKDLGADVDLVGPGEAYERWKKTPAYQEWRKQTEELFALKQPWRFGYNQIVLLLLAWGTNHGTDLCGRNGRRQERKKGHCKFLVDSGALYSLLPEKVWQAIGLKPKRTMTSTLVDGTSKDQCKTEVCHGATSGRLDGPYFCAAPSAAPGRHGRSCRSPCSGTGCPRASGEPGARWAGGCVREAPWRPR